MMNGQPMLNYQFNPQHALMAQQQQILQNQVFEHQRYVHNTQNFIQKQFHEKKTKTLFKSKFSKIQQLKEIIAQKGKKIGSNVVNWSQELPPSLPKSLRHRIFNIFMRDTNELENLMKPKNGLKISKNFINFGNRNSKKILRNNNNNNNSNINQPEDDIIIASESLTIDIASAATKRKGGVESNMLSKYYLTGITKTDNNKNKKKKQIFKHKISNGVNHAISSQYKERAYRNGED